MAAGAGAKQTVCIYKRGSITREQELCLQKHTPFLVKELKCEKIVPRLVSYCVLDKNDQKRIMGRPKHDRSRVEQNKRLVDTMMNRTPRGFEIFLNVLRETGHQNAYESLTPKQEDRGEAGKTRDSQTLSSNPSEEIDPEVRDHVYTPVTSKTKNQADAHYAQKLQRDFSGSSFENQLHFLTARLHDAQSRLDNIKHSTGLTEEQKNRSVQHLEQELKETVTELKRLRGMYAPVSYTHLTLPTRRTV